jgi:ABC-2 type transport system ATP-binding protein
VTVVYTSHYMEEVQTLCRRIAILDNGKVLACNTLTDLLKMLDGTIRFSVADPPAGFAERLAALPGVKRVEPRPGGFKLVVTDVAPALARVAALCAQTGAELAAVSAREPTLERVFLHLTGRELRD